VPAPSSRGRRLGHVNGILFRSVVGRLMSKAARSGRPVRAYGEMVALLWDAGHLDAAIDVELLWNELLAGAAADAGALDPVS
jgi:hypothetical protein